MKAMSGGNMHIVHISSEFSSLCKVGGLADVVYSLSKAQAQLGHKVTVILPFYRPLLDAVPQNPLLHFEVKENNNTYKGTAYKILQHKVEIILLDLPHPKHYFLNRSIYGDAHEHAKFIYFTKAALSFLCRQFSKGVDILHHHDWMTSAIYPLFQGEFQAYGEKIPKKILNIHNLLYQGRLPKNLLEKLGGIPPDIIDHLFITDPWESTLVNLLKAGIEYSDIITVVSPSYAKEIMTPPSSFGLEECLNRNQKKIVGILNGIDLDEWNFENDPHLPFHVRYKDSLERVIAVKEQCKQSFTKTFSLEIPPLTPQFCVITRLTEQKGLDLILRSIDFIVDKGGAFILLGSMIDESWKDAYHELKEKYIYHPKVFISYEFNEPLSHLAFASSDFILIPSIFEPCGLTQMIACRYGTIPIVRKTGGLQDSVFDLEDEFYPLEERNGFTFSAYDWEECQTALQRALDSYYNGTRNILTKNALSKDFSWKNSTEAYIQLYQS